ncbi:hypothetical protein pb186bvf_017237 [Paramecium bursaria]
MKQKKQLLGLTETQLREIVHKLQLCNASQRLDMAKLKDQISEIQTKYHRALKQIGEMEKIQRRDTDYIMKMDLYYGKMQSEQYVDALTEVTKNRDLLQQENYQLQVQVDALLVENAQLKKLNPQNSQQQFQNPFMNNIIKTSKRCSLVSNQTQDTDISIINDEDPNDSELKTFLQQLDEEQANQLMELLEEYGQKNGDKSRISEMNLIQKILSDSTENSLQTEQSSFSFSNKENIVMY